MQKVILFVKTGQHVISIKVRRMSCDANGPTFKMDNPAETFAELRAIGVKGYATDSYLHLNWQDGLSFSTGEKFTVAH